MSFVCEWLVPRWGSDGVRCLTCGNRLRFDKRLNRWFHGANDD